MLFFIMSVLTGAVCHSQSTVCAYKYRKRITIDHTKVSGSSDLTNFTTLISITADNDLRTVTNSGHVENSNGYDIIFTAADGVTQLSHQLESYTASSGQLVAWVKIPTLSASLNTYIYMYYGNTSITTDQSTPSTWNSNYKGVWHLNNNNFNDGTSSGNNGTNNGSGNVSAAKIAGGRSFTGASTTTDYVQLGLSGANGGNGNGSVSLWGFITSFKSSTYFMGATTTQTGTGYSNRLQLYQGDNAGTLYLGLGGTHALNTNVQSMSLNTWYHIALTWTTSGSGAGTYSILVNGVQKGTGSYSSWTAIHTFCDIGNDGNASQRTEELPGNIDEVHVANTNLSNDWLITEYNNQSSPSTFYSISAEPKIYNGSNNATFNASANWSNNSPANAGDDVILNNGSFQPILNTSIQYNSLYIKSGVTFSLSTFSLSIRSDVTNCGTFSDATGTLVLNSTASFIQNQNFSGTGTYSLNDVVINNTFSTNPSVTLNKDVNVAGDLTLTSGIVYTSATNILSLGNNATSTSGSASSFISGPVSKSGTANFVFPVGKGSSWRRAAIAGVSSSSVFRAEYFNTAYTSTTPVNAPLNNVSQVEYWQVDRLSGTGNASLSLYWESASASGINNCADLTIARWNGSSWDERAGTTSASSSCSGSGAGTVTTIAALTAFSPFTFGSKLSGVNPLPVELVKFTASCAGDKIAMNWSTASESQNDHFTVERSSDGTNWSRVGTVKAAGTSNQPKSYIFSDTEIQKGISYYRLSQVDLSGRKKELEIVSVDCIVAEEKMLLYPNPTTRQVSIEFDLVRDYGTAVVKIADDFGKICFRGNIDLHKGNEIHNLAIDLPPGSYTVLLDSKAPVFPPKKLLIK